MGVVDLDRDETEQRERKDELSHISGAAKKA